MTLPTLRPYQMDVVERAAGRVRRGLKRGIIQGETGCGKGHIIGYLTWRAVQKGSRVLILADRRRLVKQISAVLKMFDVRHGVIMSGESGATSESVILASRDTLAAWKRRGRADDLKPFDIVLVDETHKVMADVYQSILDLYGVAVVIGFTATPARADGKSLGDFFQFIECTVPASQLIADGWLVKPVVYAPPELAAQRKKGEVKGLAGDPVAHWLRYANGLPTIAAASRSEEAKDLVRRFTEAGIAAERIAGETDDEAGWDGKSDRDRMYEGLASGRIKVLCSVNLLIEGVDIPEIAAAIAWRKFGSVVQWRQFCGRIMRPSPGKDRAVVLDHAGAAAVHGLPGDDVQWSLDMGSTVDQRRKKDLDDNPNKKPVVCRACGLVYSETLACPQCGWVPPRAERKQTREPGDIYHARDEVLTRFDGERAAERQADERQRFWARSIYVAIAKGRTAGMAAGMFQSKFKVPPWEAGVSPLPEGRNDWKRPACEVFPSFVRQPA